MVSLSSYDVVWIYYSAYKIITSHFDFMDIIKFNKINMREIKFRGLTKENKFEYSGIVGQGLFWLRVTEGYYKDVQQFTGLHDKNGKEIYEGDILRFSKTSYHLSFNTVVIFKDGQFTTESFLVNELNKLSLKSEIIGNIYQEVLPKYENKDIIKQWSEEKKDTNTIRKLKKR